MCVPSSQNPFTSLSELLFRSVIAPSGMCRQLHAMLQLLAASCIIPCPGYVCMTFLSDTTLLCCAVLDWQNATGWLVATWSKWMTT